MDLDNNNNKNGRFSLSKIYNIRFDVNIPIKKIPSTSVNESARFVYKTKTAKIHVYWSNRLEICFCRRWAHGGTFFLFLIFLFRFLLFSTLFSILVSAWIFHHICTAQKKRESNCDQHEFSNFKHSVSVHLEAHRLCEPELWIQCTYVCACVHVRASALSGKQAEIELTADRCHCSCTHSLTHLNKEWRC